MSETIVQKLRRIASQDRDMGLCASTHHCDEAADAIESLTTRLAKVEQTDTYQKCISLIRERDEARMARLAAAEAREQIAGLCYGPEAARLTIDQHEQTISDLRARLAEAEAERESDKRTIADLEAAIKCRVMCEWTHDDTDANWGSTCGNRWQMSNDANLQENGMRFCPFCGGFIREAAKGGGE